MMVREPPVRLPSPTPRTGRPREDTLAQENSAQRSYEASGMKLAHLADPEHRIALGSGSFARHGPMAPGNLAAFGDNVSQPSIGTSLVSGPPPRA